jgi:glycosyltransferase involved in cell wall biosynthesis
MRLCVTLEYRFAIAAGTSAWTRNLYPYTFWRRYLDVFDEVVVIARADRWDASGHLCPRDGYARVDGSGVTFLALPHYRGLYQFCRQYARLRHSLQKTVGGDDAVLMRVGSPIAGILQPMLTSRGQPYGLEVVGDPRAVFAPGVIRHPLGPLVRHLLCVQLRSQCRQACAVAYVTDHYLQRHYSAARDAFAVGLSDVDLGPESFATSSLTWERPPEIPRLLAIGSLDQPYKGFHIMLRALAMCRGSGMDFRLRIIGGGRLLESLRHEAEDLGLAGRIQFLGEIGGREAVNSQLDAADLLIHPSLTEGLPRVVLEAMARGLPCIASAVGGVPELLATEDLVIAGDPAALSAKIQDVTRDVHRLARMSARNWTRAWDYRLEVLRDRRRGFLQHLRERTENRTG